MADGESTIIPLDAAHAVLAAFGIGPDNKAYQRWRRDDGFRLVDLEDVLAESQSLLIVDWREWLPDAVYQIADQLSDIGVSAKLHLGETGEQGDIEVAGRRQAIKYVPKDNDDFDHVIRSVNSLIDSRGRYRKLRSCEGTDGWAYALLSNDDWRELDAHAPELANLLFTLDGVQPA